MAESNYVSVTRAAYDATADVYAQVVGTELSAAVEAPLDRALLAAFVEMVAVVPRCPVADLGCGPGRVGAFLAAQGVDAVGVNRRRRCSRWPGTRIHRSTSSKGC